ncbi:hypothetical protein ID856_15265 [Xenorhabdus sp. 18]|nr:hypothetical protein [Xenorhabdus sp. 18]
MQSIRKQAGAGINAARGSTLEIVDLREKIILHFAASLFDFRGKWVFHPVIKQ